MKIDLTTNVEILYNSDLKNKILVQIPQTKYHVLCTYKKSKRLWNIHVLELLSAKRKIVCENVTPEVITEMVHNILSKKITVTLKKNKKIKEVAQLLKQITTNYQKNELQRNNLKRTHKSTRHASS